MADDRRALFFVGLFIIAAIVGYALLRMVAQIGITEVVSSASSPLPLPTASYDFGSFRMISFPPAPTLPADLAP